ncbi:MAG: hypothetical protein HQL56_13495 [Magnetococcales bacterium]|nr:hypothetical protein [Magnetococcales bacterium]
MSGTVSSSLQIAFNSRLAKLPFELVTDDDDQGGDAPVQVQYLDLCVEVDHWGKWRYFNDSNYSPLRMVAPGVKRVKLYCPAQLGDGVTFRIDSGEYVFSTPEIPPGFFTPPMPGGTRVPINRAKPLGRRREKVVEGVEFSGEVRKALRWPYGEPDCLTLGEWPFFSAKGEPMPTPRYDRQRGEFFATGETFGALLVEYWTEYSLFEFYYDTGEKIASSAQFRCMQDAWICGSIEATEVPPVRIMAISATGRIASGKVARRFNPGGVPSVQVRDSRIKEGAKAPANQVLVEDKSRRKTVTVPILDANGQSTGNDFIRMSETVFGGENGSTTTLRIANG